MANIKETVVSEPEPETPMQERRDWDMRMIGTMQRMLTSPRAKKKVGQYFGELQNTERKPEKKTMIKDLTWPL